VALALSGGENAKASYLELARQWNQLARELEAGRARLAISVDPELAEFVRLS
jgi:hypothetical protein